MDVRQGRSIAPIEGWRLAFALAAALLLVATAAAQPHPPLHPGDAVSARLGADLTRQTYRIDTPDAGSGPRSTSTADVGQRTGQRCRMLFSGLEPGVLFTQGGRDRS